MSGDSCYGPRCSVADFILGAGYPELDYAAFVPDRFDDPRYEVPKYIVLWGKDPLFSNPDGFFGHTLIDLMKRGCRFIVVDPRVTWMAAHADYHLQLRPGTDAALGLGMINLVIQEDLYDHDFVENWCYGFDELKERAAQYPLDKVEEITWVPAETIAAAARAVATNHPSSFMWGLAIDTNSNGVQAGHCVLILAAILGDLDVPGGVTLAVPASFMGKWRYECAQQLPPGMMEKQITDLEHYRGFQAAHVIAHPDCILDTLETKKPYPLKMAWFYATNGVANTTNAQGKRWYKGLMQKLEFNVVPGRVHDAHGHGPVRPVPAGDDVRRARRHGAAALRPEHPHGHGHEQVPWKWATATPTWRSTSWWASASTRRRGRGTTWPTSSPSSCTTAAWT